jgi:multiple sugar transport system substrate-binding protein
MAFIWNKAIFAEAGLDPESPPATWADVVAYSKQIKDKTGKFGYGMVAKVNAGNTPFRFMPMVWAHGSSALDEAEAAPTMKTTMINNEGGIKALQNMYDMYVTDRSVPTSALTNTQTENQDLFIAGQLAMVISHPSEYVTMQTKLAGAQGDEEKAMAQTVVDNMSYGLIPQGPVRRSVVFGGSNAHMFTDKAHGGPVNAEGAKAMLAALTSPEWSLKNNWTDSNPANLRGFETEWMKERLSQIKFLEVTTSMLPYGVPFPVVPESTEIMNIIIPEMIQNALTETMSVEEAANDAAERINDLISTT